MSKDKVENIISQFKAKGVFFTQAAYNDTLNSYTINAHKSSMLFMDQDKYFASAEK